MRVEATIVDMENEIRQGYAIHEELLKTRAANEVATVQDRGLRSFR